MTNDQAAREGYTAVAAKNGKQVHAADLRQENRTMCGRTFSGWTASLRKMDCPGCKLAILKVRVARGAKA